MCTVPSIPKIGPWSCLPSSRRIRHANPRAVSCSPLNLPPPVLGLPHTCHGDPSPAAGTRCSGSSPRARGGCLCFHRYTDVSASRCRRQGLQQRLQNCSQWKELLCQMYEKIHVSIFGLAHFTLKRTFIDKGSVCFTRNHRALRNDSPRHGEMRWAAALNTEPDLQRSLPLEILNRYRQELSQSPPSLQAEAVRVTGGGDKWQHGYEYRRASAGTWSRGGADLQLVRWVPL